MELALVVLALVIHAISVAWDWATEHGTVLAVVFLGILLGRAESDIRELRRRIGNAELELRQRRSGDS